MIITTPFLPPELWLQIFSHLSTTPSHLWRMRSISPSTRTLIEHYMRTYWFPRHITLYDTNWRGWLGDFSHFSVDLRTAYFRIASRRIHWWTVREDIRVEGQMSLYVVVGEQGSGMGKMKLWSVDGEGKAEMCDLGNMRLEGGDGNGGKKVVGIDWRELMDRWVSGDFLCEGFGFGKGGTGERGCTCTLPLM
jgi:hypothetical protein